MGLPHSTKYTDTLPTVPRSSGGSQLMSTSRDDQSVTLHVTLRTGPGARTAHQHTLNYSVTWYYIRSWRHELQSNINISRYRQETGHRLRVIIQYVRYVCIQTVHQKMSWYIHIAQSTDWTPTQVRLYYITVLNCHMLKKSPLVTKLNSEKISS